MRRNDSRESLLEDGDSERRQRRRPPWKRVRFYAQLAISFAVLIFCMVMVAIEDVGCEKTVFMATIAGIVGFWLPTPTA